MNRTRTLLVLLTIAWLGPLEHARAQRTPDPWYGLQANPKNVDPPRLFTGAFSIQLPKNWQIAPGHTGTVFTIVEKTGRLDGGALITLEYLRLQAPLDPALMAAASEWELREVQARELSGKNFTSEARVAPAGPFVLTQYDRPGLTGSYDHVVQYSLPVGTTMYRLVCIAPSAAIEKYRPLFAHVAASFTPVKPGG